MKKSLNIKIPLSILKQLDDNGQLNPSYLECFIVAHLHTNEGLNEPVAELSYNYTFKIDSEVHKVVKLKSIELGINMNEYVARLLVAYYRAIDSYGDSNV